MARLETDGPLAPPMNDSTQRLITAAQTLRAGLARLTFGPPVTHVYDPLEYAWAAQELYLRRFGASPKRVVFLGMNPGPFGMVQTGVPFGEISAVRDWMGLEAPVKRPRLEHPKRPVLGFACPRSEVSGRRLWGLFAQRFGTAERFFQEHFVANYCPLAFFEGEGKNRTPDKLPAGEQAALTALCDAHLRQVVGALGAQWVIGIGAFAAKRAGQAALGEAVQLGTILHPSPASPAANRGWAGTVVSQLESLGLW